MPYSGVDYYNINEWLNEEERLVQDMVRKWVDDKVLPNIENNFRDGEFPMHLVREMGELGLFGITIPEEYGGAGIGYVAYGIAMQELERGDSGLRSFASVISSLIMYPIFTWGTEEQKKFWLPKLARGEKIGAFGLTEPDYGSDPGRMITNAKRVDGGYILNGAKMWITNSPIADVIVIWAKLDGKVCGFLIEKGSQGLSCPEMKDKWSLRASVTGEVILQDVFVPESNRLPDANGLACALTCLDQARFGIACGVIGAMQACYDSSLEYSKTRIQHGKPIAGFQMVQDSLVTMLTEITKAQLLVLRLGRLREKGEANFRQVSLAKRNNCRIALEIARSARDLHGANGISGEYPIMRHP
ncbi:MAG: acyl-CoA dehydrogenase family protein [Candidatus Electryonea clarkiae]|nr:acyl-CoA dehydrogenase family protein [Candidatus Electryonea clarkiae]MDP8288170.1 acyl-CoA dehydrogenase family protein [Candidatus Electryonea clarkiae]